MDSDMSVRDTRGISTTRGRRALYPAKWLFISDVEYSTYLVQINFTTRLLLCRREHVTSKFHHCFDSASFFEYRIPSKRDIAYFRFQSNHKVKISIKVSGKSCVRKVVVTFWQELTRDSDMSVRDTRGISMTRGRRALYPAKWLFISDVDYSTSIAQINFTTLLLLCPSVHVPS
jgi:hypothetical protein